MRFQKWRLLLILALASAGCTSTGGSKPVHQGPSPAKVTNGGMKEGDLATIILTEQAERRLGIQTASVSSGRVAQYRTLAGEVVLPPGAGQTVSSPVAGTVHMEEQLPSGTRVAKGQALVRILPIVSAQRDVKVTAEAEISAARSRLEAARLAAARAEKMLQNQVGSVRAVEQAQLEQKLAQAGYDAAQAKLQRITQAPLDADVNLTISSPQDGLVRQWFVASGQMVTAGAPLFEITDYARVWVRVPVYAGEIKDLATRAKAKIENLGGSPGVRTAAPVDAPPTADPLSATVDLYYQLDNSDQTYHPGQKLNVSLPLTSSEQSGLHVPRAAILHDYLGGSWVYERTAPHTYTRRRVEIARTVGESAVLTRGPQSGVEVVTAGAAELFGTEFGAGK